MIGIMLVSHARMASETKAAVEYILEPKADFHAIDILNSDDVEKGTKDFTDALGGMLRQCDEVLVMVDIFGATPCNIAMNVISQVYPSSAIALVAGFNLPSVLKALMERKHLPLSALADACLDSGQKYMRLGAERAESILSQQNKAA